MWIQSNYKDFVAKRKEVVLRQVLIKLQINYKLRKLQGVTGSYFRFKNTTEVPVEETVGNISRQILV